MSMIQVKNVTFGYDGSYDTIFEDVSFQIDTDWKLGFIGRNGRGKTTFLKLLMGEYEYRGTITAGTDFVYFPFTVPDKSKNTLDIVDGITPHYEFWELCRELSLLRVSEDVLFRPFCTLSNGEQTKVLLAALFLREGSFLLIDEPTNHLDIAARELVGTYLNGKKGFILVSHDRDFLDRCIDHVLSINRNNIEVQKGNFSTWQVNKDRQDAFERAENEKLKKDVKRLKAAARRTADWSDAVEKTKFGQRVSGIKPDKGYIGHKAAKMMKRSKAVEDRMEKAAEEKAKLLRNLDTAETLAVRTLQHHQDRLVAFQGVTIRYGEKIVQEDIRFELRQGERVALYGPNGCGKTSILKQVLSGGPGIWKAGGLKLSYVSQDTSFLGGNLKGFAEEAGVEEALFKAILRKLDFSREQFDKDIADFSEGQKKKVLLARSLCEEAHLYLWDEPLNFVDVLSRIQIQELLLTYRPTMLFVEHDRAFVDAVATRQIHF